MIKRLTCCSGFVLLTLSLFSQHNQWWRAELKRPDGIIIPFNFEAKFENGQPAWYIRNAGERLKVDNFQPAQDSIIVSMPLFESDFRLKPSDGLMEGVWIKGTSGNDQVMPTVIRYGDSLRFRAALEPKFNISGRWEVIFRSNDTTSRPAIAEFQQSGNNLIGTFLTLSGDYRYLEGVVDGDSLKLSTFDGSHAYYFNAKILSSEKIAGGNYYSGARGHQKWTAVKNSEAKLPDDASAVYLKEGEERLNFSFFDLDGKKISINDERFKNKVVIIQLMGSWCPNCMDETKFLSEYYQQNKNRGIEIISLAYEYSEDYERSKKSLRKFQQRFNVQYPMLITGVKTSDSLRTEKTLPQLTTIKMFPTTIFIGKDGKVKKIDTGFTGPGTGEHYQIFLKRFYSTVDGLLSEPRAAGR